MGQLPGRTPIRRLHAGSYLQYGMPTSIRDEVADKIILTESIIWAEPGMRDMLRDFLYHR